MTDTSAIEKRELTIREKQKKNHQNFVSQRAS